MHPSQRLLSIRIRQHIADVNDFNFGGIYEREGACHAERILLIPDVAKDGDAKPSRNGSMRKPRGARLVDHLGLRTFGGSKLIERPILQHDQSIRVLERSARVRVGVYIAVNIGAGQYHDQRALGIFFPEKLDGRQAASRMQGDQHVAWRFIPSDHYPNMMSARAKERCIARRGMAIAGSRACGRRRHDDDSH